MEGRFVISLDFELFWGVRDKRSLSAYGESLERVHHVVPRMIKLFNRYGVKATFATVGFLFADKKDELISYSPDKKPFYSDKNLSPYSDNFDLVKENTNSDPYHFAPDLIKFINRDSGHEVGSHTFSHFYCLEEGQEIEDFNNDIRAAVSIASNKNISLDSLVFPRNQYNKEYLKVLKRHGIKTYRGNEKVWFHVGQKESSISLFKRIFRTLNCYLNISGHHCYNIKNLAKETPYNIPSSRFLRPYAKNMFLLEWLKIRRIKKSMTYAAKKGLIYHIWWHPHNFGNYTDENFRNLEEILKHYYFLSTKYGFTSSTMSEMADLLDKLRNKTQIL